MCDDEGELSLRLGIEIVRQTLVNFLVIGQMGSLRKAHTCSTLRMKGWSSLRGDSSLVSDRAGYQDRSAEC